MRCGAACGAGLRSYQDALRSWGSAVTEELQDFYADEHVTRLGIEAARAGYTSARTALGPRVAHQRPHRRAGGQQRPRRRPALRSEAPQVGCAEELSPPVDRPESATATPTPVKITPPSVAVITRE